MSEHFKKIVKFLSLFIPFCYIAMGCALLTDLFASIDKEKRLIFGLVIIAYGTFRIFRAFAKNRDMS